MSHPVDPVPPGSHRQGWGVDGMNPCRYPLSLSDDAGVAPTGLVGTLDGGVRLGTVAAGVAASA